VTGGHTRGATYIHIYASPYTVHVQVLCTAYMPLGEASGVVCLLVCLLPGLVSSVSFSLVDVAVSAAIFGR
jgi:hypothetical protein